MHRFRDLMLNTRTAGLVVTFAFPLLMVSGLFGCETKSSAAETARTDSLSSDETDGALLRADALARALKELRAAAGEPTLALSLTVKSNKLVLQAQDRERPSRVVEYSYRRGRVSDPVPVELRGGGKLEENLFPLSDVKLDHIEALTRAAIEQVDPQDGKVREVVVRRNLPIDHSVQIRVYVDSPRRNGSLDATQDGRPL